MGITIIKEPISFLPVLVRNPIEIGLETDNYMVYVPGRKTITSVVFNSISNMVAGNQFTANMSGTIITFTITASPSNENEVLPRSSFAAGIGGSWAYGTHLQSKFSSHSDISPKFTSTYLYPSFHDTHTEMEFTSIINEPLTLVFTKISGSYTILNSVTQTGVLDEYDNRQTVVKIGMYFNAHGDPVDLDYFYMHVDGKPYTFQFRTSPDNSGYQFPLRGALSLTDYQNLLLRCLKSAPCFVDKFDITTSLFGGEIHFIFTSIGYVAGDIYNTNNSTRYVWVNLPGYQAVYRPNFLTNIRLLCEKNYRSGDYEKIVDLYAYPVNEPVASVNHFISRYRVEKLLYDFMNKTYKENLQAALPYSANYPNAHHLLKLFYFRFFESYGTPSENKFISDSSPYVAALSGVGHLAFVNRKYLSAFGWLHPSGIIDNAMNLKQYVDKDQPAWLYFYMQPSDGNDIGGVTRIYMVIYYDDGSTYTTDFTYVPAFDVPINECKAFFIPAGYRQRVNDFGNTSTKSSYMWDIIVEIDDGDCQLSKRFVLDCTSCYRSYLMYQNSYGGYDTVVITAPKEHSLELTDGKEVERILSDDYKTHDSQFEATIPKVRQSVKANLGFKKTTDFDVLKELLISKYVFVLPKGTSDVFIPVNIDHKTIKLESEDDFEKNYTFEFSPAHEFKNFENNIWSK